MVALVIVIILGIIAVIAVGVALVSEDLRFGAGGAAVVCVILGAVILVFSMYDRVDTRNVGIVTSFGRPERVCSAGPCWHAPWKSVHELSEAIQLQSFESNSYDDASRGQASPNAGGPAINVRLANNSNAFVDLNLNWRIREGAAAKMFQDYGGGNVFDTIRQQLVDRQAQVMASKVFATFNPQTQAQPVTPTAAPAAATPTPTPTPAPTTPTPAPAPNGMIPTPMQGADLPNMAAQVKKDLQDAVGTEIEILDVRIPRLWYDQPTQQRIDQFNQQVQETLNAAQQVKTAEQQRLAAEQRANQPPPDLRIAIFNCLTDQVKAGKDPAGCWGQIGGTPLIQVPH